MTRLRTRPGTKPKGVNVVIGAWTPTDPEPHPSSSVRAWAWYVEAAHSPSWKAQFLSEINGELARLSGDRSVATPVLPAEVPPEVRAAFAPGRDPMDELLGFWEAHDAEGNGLGWHPGLAGLQPQEREAYRLHLRRFSLKEIQEHMGRARTAGRRRTESLFPGFQRPEPQELISIGTIEEWVRSARHKLRVCLGAVGVPGGKSSTTISNTSYRCSTNSPGTSAPLPKTPRTSFTMPSLGSSSMAT